MAMWTSVATVQYNVLMLAHEHTWSSSSCYVIFLCSLTFLSRGHRCNGWLQSFTSFLKNLLWACTSPQKDQPILHYDVNKGVTPNGSNPLRCDRNVMDRTFSYSQMSCWTCLLFPSLKQEAEGAKRWAQLNAVRKWLAAVGQVTPHQPAKGSWGVCVCKIQMWPHWSHCFNTSSESAHHLLFPACCFPQISPDYYPPFVDVASIFIFIINCLKK